MEWFRFYSEVIRDTKIRRVARKANQSPAHVIGVWSILLSMASESQERGVLMLGSSPVTLDDIEDVTGCNVSETLHEMLQVGMLDFDGICYSIPAWGKRQYASDNSTPRVKRHRDKVKQEAETLQKRFRNAPETETETETETEVPPPTFQDDMTHQYEAVLGMVPTASYPEMLDYMRKLNERKVIEWWGMALRETTGARKPGWQYMKAILESWLAAGLPTHFRTNGNGNDPTIRKSTVPGMTPAEQAAADARQEAYERQMAEELARAGLLR